MLATGEDFYGMSRADAHDRPLSSCCARVQIPEKADAFPDELSGGQQATRRDCPPRSPCGPS